MDSVSRMYTHRDYDSILSWYAAWKLPAPPQSLIPTGFIVPTVCAGFLYLTDTTLGIIDLYISNPEVPKEKRDRCLDIITGDLIIHGKNSGCKILMATSNVPAVKKRSEFHGFKYSGDTSVYMREI